MRQYLLEKRDPAKLPGILIKVAQGVQELHNLGFIHRDLKPDNIVVGADQDDVAIIDFNRAMPCESRSPFDILGTPGYHPDT